MPRAPLDGTMSSSEASTTKTSQPCALPDLTPMVWVCGLLGGSALCGVGLHRQAQHPREPYSRDRRLGFCRPHAVPGGSGWPFRPVAEPTRNARVDGYGPRRVRMGLERSGSDRRRGVAGLFARLVIVHAHRLDAYGPRHSKEWVVTGDRRGGARDGGLWLGLQLDRLRRSLGSALGARWFRAAIQYGLGGAGGGAVGGGH